MYVGNRWFSGRYPIGLRASASRESRPNTSARPAVGCVQESSIFHERGLARAIRPQQSVRGPPPYPQRHVVYRRQRPPRPPVLKNLRQAFRVDRVLGRKFTHALTITNREAGSFAILLFVMPAATRFAAVALLFGCSLGPVRCLAARMWRF